MSVRIPLRSRLLPAAFLFPSLVGLYAAIAQESFEPAAPSPVAPIVPAAPVAPAPSSVDTSSGLTPPPLFRETSVVVPGVVNPTLPLPRLQGQFGGIEGLEGNVTALDTQLNLQAPNLLNGSGKSEQAHLKMGPLYLHVDSLTARVLYSDQVEGNQSNETWQSWTELHFTLTADVGERLNISAQGQLFYWPFDNRLDFLYFGRVPSALVNLNSLFGPQLHSQVAYTAPVAEWPITLADDLRISRGRYANSYRYTLDDIRFGNKGGGSISDNGTYTFADAPENNKGNSPNATEFTVINNSITASTQKDIPGTAVFNARLAHDDFWYYPRQDLLPASRNQLDASLVSVRENTRFKPYLRYNITETGADSNISQQVRVGAFGPATEQIMLQGDLGYFVRESDQHLVGMLDITHSINSITSENLRLDRSISFFQDQVQTQATYEIRRLLADGLDGRLMVTAGKYESTAETAGSHDEIRTGFILTYDTGAKSRIRSGTLLTKISQSDRSGTGVSTFLNLTYKVTDTLNFEALYEFDRITASDAKFDRDTTHTALVSLRKMFR
jgi:hypothetical protein